jgi:hypothetical protein
MKIGITIISFLLLSCSSQRITSKSNSSFTDGVKEVLRKQILEKADWALQQRPVTVTAQASSRAPEVNMIFIVKVITGGPIRLVLIVLIYRKME